MVEFAAVIIVVVFVGYVLNALKRASDIRRFSRMADELLRRKEALEAQGKKGSVEYTEVISRLDRTIRLLELCERRDISPLK